MAPSSPPPPPRLTLALPLERWSVPDGKGVTSSLLVPAIHFGSPQAPL